MTKKKEIEKVAVEAEEKVEIVGEPAEIVAEPVVSDEDKFIRNKLSALNKMDNAAKAQRLARRIFRNRKEN